MVEHHSEFLPAHEGSLIQGLVTPMFDSFLSVIQVGLDMLVKSRLIPSPDGIQRSVRAHGIGETANHDDRLIAAVDQSLHEIVVFGISGCLLENADHILQDINRLVVKPDILLDRNDFQLSSSFYL